MTMCASRIGLVVLISVLPTLLIAKVVGVEPATSVATIPNTSYTSTPSRSWDLSPITRKNAVEFCNPVLDLSFCFIGWQGIPNLLEHMAQRKTLAEIDSTSLEISQVDKSQSGDGKREGDEKHHSLSGVPSPPSSLNLRECALGDAGVALLAASPHICGEAGIAGLSLRQNQLTSAGSGSLFDNLRKCPKNNLVSLSLDFNPIGDAGVQLFPAYFKERGMNCGGGMEELSLRFCNLSPVSCRYLSSALLKNSAAASTPSTVVQEGKVEVDPPSSSSSPTTSTSVRKEGIRRLLLTGNHVGDAGARALASALRKNCQLEILDLTMCRIGDEGAKVLTDALLSNTKLRELRLGYNKISEIGVTALSKLFRESQEGRLEVLDLSGNMVGDGGACALASALRGSSSRKRRSRSGNSAVGGEGHNNQTPGGGLRRLNLACSGVGCVGACALAAALEEGGGLPGVGMLEELELSGNMLSLRASEASQGDGSYLTKTAGDALSSIGNLFHNFVDETYWTGTSSSKENWTANKNEDYRPGTAVRISGTGMSRTQSKVSGRPEFRAQGARGGLRSYDEHSGGAHGTYASNDVPYSSGNTASAAPQHCGILALARALEKNPTLRFLGLGQTGLDERDARLLAGAIRRRDLGSRLERVEVRMNGLNDQELDAIRSALDTPSSLMQDEEEEEEEEELSLKGGDEIELGMVRTPSPGSPRKGKRASATSNYSSSVQQGRRPHHQPRKPRSGSEMSQGDSWTNQCAGKEEDRAVLLSEEEGQGTDKGAWMMDKQQQGIVRDGSDWEGQGEKSELDVKVFGKHVHLKSSPPGGMDKEPARRGQAPWPDSVKVDEEEGLFEGEWTETEENEFVDEPYTVAAAGVGESSEPEFKSEYEYEGDSSSYSSFASESWSAEEEGDEVIRGISVEDEHSSGGRKDHGRQQKSEEEEDCIELGRGEEGYWTEWDDYDGGDSGLSFSESNEDGEELGGGGDSGRDGVKRGGNDLGSDAEPAEEKGRFWGRNIVDGYAGRSFRSGGGGGDWGEGGDTEVGDDDSWEG